MSDETQTASGAKQVLAQLQQLWGKSSKRRKMIAVGVVVAVVAAIAFVTLRQGEPGWVSVSDGMSPESIGDLNQSLAERGIPARLKGGVLEVKEDSAAEARAIAARMDPAPTESASIVESGPREAQRLKRQLERDLARSIVQLTQVEAARVHLSFGKTSPFKGQEIQPSASIVLRLFRGQSLTQEQVRGVRGLVAGAITGLAAEKVVLIDNHGTPLDGADPKSTDPQGERERTVSANVRAMLEKAVGKGHVSVVTTAEFDTRQISETEEIYDKDKSAIRSESKVVDGANAAQTAATLTGGIAGTQGNLPGAPAPTTGPAGPAGDGHVQQTTNYEVSRVVRQTQNPAATLKRIHVAILVDDKVDEDGNREARSTEELATLTAIATRAAGIDATRGDVLELRSVPFVADPDSVLDAPAAPAGPPWWLRYAIVGGAALIGLLAIFIILKKMKKSEAKVEVTKAPPPLSLPAPITVIEAALEAGQTPVAATLEGTGPAALPEGKTAFERVTVAVRNDVDRTAHILSSWLADPAPKALTK
jgi:flagellar M-ring protein FliF